MRSHTFTPDRIRWVAQNAQAEFLWDYFDSVVEKNYFYLFTRGHSVMCIPKRSIPTERLQDFAAIVRDHVPSDSSGSKRSRQIGPLNRPETEGHFMKVIGNGEIASRGTDIRAVFEEIVRSGRQSSESRA